MIKNFKVIEKRKLASTGGSNLLIFHYIFNQGVGSIGIKMESMDLKSTLSASASACLIFSLPELLLLKGGKKCALVSDSGAIVFKGYIKGFFVISIS